MVQLKNITTILGKIIFYMFLMIPRMNRAKLSNCFHSSFLNLLHYFTLLVYANEMSANLIHSFSYTISKRVK